MVLSKFPVRGPPRATRVELTLTFDSMTNGTLDRSVAKSSRVPNAKAGGMTKPAKFAERKSDVVTGAKPTRSDTEVKE